MYRNKAASLCLGVMLAMTFPMAQAQDDTIRIGVITSLSGPASESGAQMRAGIDTYLRSAGNTVAGKKIEVIYKDDTGPSPDVAKRLATELLTRDKVDLLAGFVFTPNAMAAAGVATQAKKPMVIMNAAASGITSRSPVTTRVSYTIAQSAKPLAEWAYKSGSRRVVTLVSDYSAGLEAETWFNKTFTEAGGKIVESVRMPLSTIDFSAFLQRVKDNKPDAVHVFLPNGQPMIAFIKAYREKELDKSGIRFLGGEGWADDDVFKAGGDTLTGIYTAGFYSFTRPGTENAKFVEAFSRTVDGKFKPSFIAASAYDGMALIFKTLEKTKGNTDPQAFFDALKGYTSSSPRGTVAIDPETRDIVQTIYIRRIDKVDGKLVATEIEKFNNVKDPAK
jgi:branched-chain amino acid transport system substrate-binding protein